MLAIDRQAAVLALTLAAACSRASPPDAYGNLEATEVVVGTQTSGQLLWFTPAEGNRVPADARVALIDTMQLALERAQLNAQRASTASRVNEVSQQIGVLEVQREIAQRAYERTKRLYAQQAATAQQLDQTERDYRVLGSRFRQPARNGTQSART